MYVDDINLFTKKKRIEDSDTNNMNIQPEFRNGICHRKISHVHKEK